VEEDVVAKAADKIGGEEEDVEVEN